jgi:hypothetical protein
MESVFGVREGEQFEQLRQRLPAVTERAQSPWGMLMLLPAFQRNLGPLTGSLKQAHLHGDAALLRIELIAHELLARRKHVTE